VSRAAEEKPREKAKRVNIELKDDVHTKAKLIAVLTGTPLGKYFEKAIEDAVKRDKKLLEEAVGK
jgi:hypothetical protein